MNEKRIENIKKLLLREQTHAAKPGAAICEECRVLRAELAEEIPDLLAEIGRLKKEYERMRGIAIEGWDRAHEAAEDKGDEESEDVAAKMLSELQGGVSAAEAA